MIERAGTNFSASVPDLPGCVATGADIEAVTAASREEISLRVTGTREDAEAIPAPTTIAVSVNVAA